MDALSADQPESERSASPIRPGGLSPLGRPGGLLGSLSQAARSKKLKTARNILIFLGVVTILLNGAQGMMAEGLVDRMIEKEFGPGAVVDPDERLSVVNMVRLVAVGFTVVGATFIGLALIIQKFPVPATVSALVIYLSTQALQAIAAPESVAQGIIIKIFIVVALFAAVKAAFGYEAERRAALAESAP